MKKLFILLNAILLCSNILNAQTSGGVGRLFEKWDNTVQRAAEVKLHLEDGTYKSREAFSCLFKPRNPVTINNLEYTVSDASDVVIVKADLVQFSVQRVDPFPVWVILPSNKNCMIGFSFQPELEDWLVADCQISGDPEFEDLDLFRVYTLSFSFSIPKAVFECLLRYEISGVAFAPKGSTDMFVGNMVLTPDGVETRNDFAAWLLSAERVAQ